MIPHAIKHAVEKFLQSKINGYQPVSGGCINQGGELRVGEEKYFIKWNDANCYPKMFATESLGLALLSQQKLISVPNVLYTDAVEQYQFILMEWIESGRRSVKYWEKLGVLLAKLHKATAESFGLEYDNYIGSLRQFNNQKTNWIEFFRDQRLEVQLKLAVDNHKLERSIVEKFEALYRRLDSLLPIEKPSLLHGDLWTGNLMTTSSGEPCLIDPAVYFGHREAEIAFTKLFGGFDDIFYDSYQQSFSLEKNFDERVDLYNLYPVLVHVNLFGGSYVNQVLSIITRFT